MRLTADTPSMPGQAHVHQDDLRLQLARPPRSPPRRLARRRRARGRRRRRRGAPGPPLDHGMVVDHEAVRTRHVARIFDVTARVKLAPCARSIAVCATSNSPRRPSDGRSLAPYDPPSSGQALRGGRCSARSSWERMGRRPPPRPCARRPSWPGGRRARARRQRLRAGREPAAARGASAGPGGHAVDGQPARGRGGHAQRSRRADRGGGRARSRPTRARATRPTRSSTSPRSSAPT